MRTIENACARGESLLITMDGVAMAQLIPLRREPKRVAPRELFGSMKGQVGITGDIVSPLFAPIEEVEALKKEIKRLRRSRNPKSKITNQN